MLKKLLFYIGILSIIINTIVFVYSKVTTNEYITIKTLKNDKSLPRFSSALIITTPLHNDNYYSVSFGMTCLVLEQGDTAFFQISAKIGKAQSNTVLDYRCDNAIASVISNKHRAEITAISQGETVISAIVGDEIIPVCFLTVK